MHGLLGIDLVSGGTVTNRGNIAGGYGGRGLFNYPGGNGGTGIEFASGGLATNSGTVTGGQGGPGGEFNFAAGDGYAGGEGINLASGGTIANSGTIFGGGGGSGGCRTRTDFARRVKF